MKTFDRIQESMDYVVYIVRSILECLGIPVSSFRWKVDTASWNADGSASFDVDFIGHSDNPAMDQLIF